MPDALGDETSDVKKPGPVVALVAGLVYPSKVHTLKNVAIVPSRNGTGLVGKLVKGDVVIATVDDRGDGGPVRFYLDHQNPQAEAMWKDFVADARGWYALPQTLAMLNRDREKPVFKAEDDDDTVAEMWVYAWSDVHLMEKRLESSGHNRLYVQFTDTPEGEWVGLHEYKTVARFMEEVRLRYGEKLKAVYIGKKPKGLAEWVTGATPPKNSRERQKAFGRYSKVPKPKKGVTPKKKKRQSAAGAPDASA